MHSRNYHEVGIVDDEELGEERVVLLAHAVQDGVAIRVAAGVNVRA
jgi:hypothetical protein